jgi:hypothetical protein
MVKILYIGALDEGTTCLMRMRALQRLGYEVIGVDTSDPRTSKMCRRLFDRITYKAGYPWDSNGVNRRILNLAQSRRPDLVWVDKGLVIKRSTLLCLKSLLPRTTLAYFNPDDPFGGYGLAGWRRFLHALDAYDVHFVPREVNIQDYQKRGAKKVVLQIPSWGYDPEIHRPRTVSDDFRRRFGADIGFVGFFEKARAESIVALAAAGLQVCVIGPWPSGYVRQGMLYSRHPVFGASYAECLQCFKITLCFLRKNNRDLYTSRSIEIPACGAFMLAERTSVHQTLFEEGKEAEFFSSPEELQDKARFYLRDDVARERVARAGRLRCERSNYSYDGLMRRRMAVLGFA